MPSTISSKNEAPCSPRKSATRCARGLVVTGSADGRASRFHSGAARLGNSEMGDVRMGPLPDAAAAGGVNRVHIARPERQRSSSQVKS